MHMTERGCSIVIYSGPAVTDSAVAVTDSAVVLHLQRQRMSRVFVGFMYLSGSTLLGLLAVVARLSVHTRVRLLLVGALEA